MRNVLLLIFPLFLVLTVPAGQAIAQTSTGGLRGQATDPSGAVVSTASVSATDASGKTTTSKTDGQGNYEFRNLPSGTYTVTAVAKGFATAQQQVEVVAGRTTQQNIALEIQVEQQHVNVDAEEVGVDVSPSNSAATLVLKGSDLDSLSDDPDELQEQLQALAGPAAGPNGGEIYVDGFSGAQLPPKSSIREIRVNQNPFSAEYDRVGYGRIEILTKPGTDNLSGQFMLMGNASPMNSRNPFLSTTPDYHSEMYRGNVSGSLSKKASYFISLDRRSQNDSSVIDVPALGLSQSVNSPSSMINFTPRFDYQVTPSNTLTLRYQYNTSSATNQGVDTGNSEQPSLLSQAYNTSSTTHGIQVVDNQIINSHMINETRFAYSHASTQQEAQNNTPSVSVLGAFTGGGSTVGMYSSTTSRYELQNSTSITSGKHYFKFGGRLRDIEQSTQSDANFNGSFTFDSLAAYNVTTQGQQAQSQCLAANPLHPELCGPSMFSINSGSRKVGDTYVDAGIYATDDWRILPKVTFSYGLRYETQNRVFEHHDFAPRLSIAWAVGKSAQPKTVVRLGYGIFYDRLTQSMMTQVDQVNGTNQQQTEVTDPDFFTTIPALSSLTNNGTGTRSAIYQFDPHLTSPYNSQTALTIDRQLVKRATMSVTYINSRGVHQFYTRDINAPYPGTYSILNPFSGVRPLGNIGDIYQYESGGLMKQNQLTTNFNIRPGTRFTLFGFFSLNGADSNTSGGFPSNEYDLNQDWGRASYATRMRAVVGGSVNLPQGFSLMPFMMTQSGSPYNLIVGQDLNGDGQFSARPTFATASTPTANVVQTPCGAVDRFPQPGETVIPINCATGPSQFRLNLRLSKTIGIGKKAETTASNGPGGPGGGGPPPMGGFGGGGGRGGGPPMGGMGGFGGGRGGPGGPGGVSAANYRYRLAFSVSASNILNHVNLATPQGNLMSPYFGQSTSIVGSGGSMAANRRVDVQMMFSF
jgi:hypothetical protein